MKTKENVLLNIKNLHVWYRVYGGYLKVLNGVHLMVREGERVGLVGEAGCGKTTTMKSILQILPPGDFHIPQGQIFYKGQDILKMNFKELQSLRSREIAMIFQDPTAALNPVFTIGNQIGDVIKYSDAFKENVNKKKIKMQSIKVLKEVYLPDSERIYLNYPFQLSGGMRQRVCIAMAISSPRNLLIADEPGTSLDVTIQDQINRFLNEIVEKRNTAIILVTHSLGVVKEMADRIYVMYAGTIVETATSEALFKNPVHPYTKGLLASVPKITGGGISKGIPGKLPSYLNPPSGCRFQPRCEQESSICSEKSPQLTEIEKDHLVACYLNQR
ncbi:MAG: ABC transporter ATP-binding protein [Candidatus Atribacteria bacterium]|nr:ABC transporter ATP-binding protein [Candidatus Atribacteria bacterium]